MKKITILCLLLLFFAGKAFADDSSAVTPTGFHISLGVWVSPNFSGVTQAGGGTLISTNHDLGITDQTLLVPEVSYRWSHGQILDFRYSQIDETVTQKLAVPEVFEGIAFAQGAPETTHEKLQWGDIDYELPIYYDRYAPEHLYLNAIAELKILRGTFSMTDQFGNTSSHNPIQVPFPLLGVHGKFDLGHGTSAEFKMAGVFAGFEDAVGYSYDLEGGVTHRFDNFDIGLEYRNFTFYNRDASGNIFAFRFYGPQFNAGYHF